MYPFTELYITNTTGAVAGAPSPFVPESIKAGQLLLVDRNMNAITATTTARDLSSIHVVTAKVDGQIIVSAAISTIDIKGPAQYQKYSAASPFTYTITTQQLDDNARADGTPTIAILRIMREDNVTTSIVGRQWLSQADYLKGDVASQKRALVIFDNYMRKKAGTFGVFTSSLSADGLTLTIKGQDPKLEEIGSRYANTFNSYVLFDHKNDGLKLVSSTTYSYGNGLGISLVELEQKLDVGLQLGRHNPFPAGYSGTAQRGGKYNVYSLTWEPRFLADLTEIHSRRLTVVAAFPTDDAAAQGAQETAFRAALTVALTNAHNMGDADTTELIEAAVDANDPENTSTEV
jgi:hypothetical protein